MKKENSAWWIPEKFDLRDPHLPSLANHAATDIDNHILQRETVDYSSVIRLGKLMYMITESYEGGNRISARDDPTILVFLSKFFEGFNNKKSESIDEVVETTRETALDLLRMRELPQERLRNLCCRLSKKINSYSPQIPLRHYVA